MCVLQRIMNFAVYCYRFDVGEIVCKIMHHVPVLFVLAELCFIHRT